MNPVTHEILTRRVKQLGNLPAMPAILSELSNALSVPASRADVEEIARTIGYDKSLAAQCLRMANSALYQQRCEVSTVREAVLTLGIWRIRDLAFSCNLPRMFAGLKSAVPHELFWRHALGTAILAQKLGQDFGNQHNEQTYLAGLLHDIGILINGLLFPEDFRDVMKEAVEEHALVAGVEQRVMGFTHAESGRILAEAWKLPSAVADVIEHHHSPENELTDGQMTVLVQLANQWCWKRGLGYGYSPEEYEVLEIEDTWLVLEQQFPKRPDSTCSEYAGVLEHHLAEARQLADQVFGSGDS